MRKFLVCCLALMMILSLTACGKGSLKDILIDGYDNLIQSVSKHALTEDKDLMGERENGVDEYTGSYEADYKNFNGKEFLFGGTALERKDGNDLKVTYTLKITEGTASLYWLAAGEQYTIATEDADDVYEFTISAGDNYIVLKGQDFSGTLTMTVDNNLPGGMLDRLEELVGKLGQTQITDDNELIGSREAGIDNYVGSYGADCDNISGRDVIFGGASARERILYISGNVNIESGTATVRIRLNDEVLELTPDENGYFETELSLVSGGNYIMVQYEDFKGTMDLRSTYDNSSDDYKI